MSKWKSEDDEFVTKANCEDNDSQEVISESSKYEYAIQDDGVIKLVRRLDDNGETVFENRSQRP